MIRPTAKLFGMRIYAVVILLSFAATASSQGVNDSLITVLRNEIARKEFYVKRKIERIEKLTKRLNGIERRPLEERFALYNLLYHQYKTFIYDSAFAYAQKLTATAYRMGDPSLIDYARVKTGFILISSGMFKETFDSLKVVNAKNLADSSRVDYYRLLSRAFSDLTVYNRDHFYRDIYRPLQQKYMDSALMWCKPRSYSWYYLTAVKNLYDGKFNATVGTERELLENLTLTDPQLAVNYFDLGNAYKGLNDPDNSVRCWALSSLSDIRAATKETAAMHNLASLLYNRGDIGNAYIFINQALDDAEFYGARQRKVEIGSILPVIAAAYVNTVENQRKIWLVYSSALTILAIVVLIFSLIIFKQLKKLKAAGLVIERANAELQEINNRLQEADKIKEEYIGYYFGNNSEYIDKIEIFQKTIGRKIQSRSVDDLRYLVNTINPAHEREELYFNFDKIFIKLFPDFVTTINSWFSEEDRINLKEDQLLNTELRIFALIRLGIHDAEKIARILGYSVNTIYAYKNRLKSRSVLPNEEFEKKIMMIRTVPAPGN